MESCTNYEMAQQVRAGRNKNALSICFILYSTKYARGCSLFDEWEIVDYNFSLI